MSVAEIARKHDVRAILDGNVNRAGDRLRVTAFLTDARRNEQVWSENYRREYSVDALFDIQADIARSIAGALETELTAGGSPTLPPGTVTRSKPTCTERCGRRTRMTGRISSPSIRRCVTSARRYGETRRSRRPARGWAWRTVPGATWG